MQVTAVQLNSVWENKPASQARVRRLLENCDLRAGGLIVLPEMYDTGFSMDVSRTAQTDERESEAFLKWLAREFQAAVLGGVVGPALGGVASNEAVAFAPDGNELVRYRKMQPFTLAGEHLKYGRGSRHCVFRWGGVRVSPFICYDLRFPERFRPAARDGAELITVSACWPQTRSEHWVRLLQARAIENLAYVVGVNRCGKEPTLTYDGRSAAFDFMGEALFEANGSEQVFSVEMDCDALHAWRRRFPALEDMRQ